MVNTTKKGLGRLLLRTRAKERLVGIFERLSTSMINWFGTTLPGNLEAFDLEMLERGARAAKAVLAARKWGSNAQNDSDFITASKKR